MVCIIFQYKLQVVVWDRNISVNSYFCAWAEDQFMFNVCIFKALLPSTFSLFYFILKENIHIVQKAKNKHEEGRWT